MSSIATCFDVWKARKHISIKNVEWSALEQPRGSFNLEGL